MVMGPAGVGKSTYCRVLQEHAANSNRTIHVVNLDPAAEAFEYDVAFDIRDLITLTDAMEELDLGPNGGLVYCMEYLLDNIDWLKNELDNYDEDEYIIFDCPGQVELYSHIPVMKNVLEQLKMWDFNVCGVYALDATFMGDLAKFISGTLLSLSAMVQLELPHINVLTKCDLADMEEVESFLDMDNLSLAASMQGKIQGRIGLYSREINLENGNKNRKTSNLPKLERLTNVIAEVIDEFSMVGFIPLNINDEESIGLIMQHADYITQYGENIEPKQPADEYMDEEIDAPYNLG
mmetsp:Transcript_5944/g.8946  ORF Transcript_5944/g.8946 Transcript_5944/m.8946 type:complete len:293 (-) Transcript_5944:31-909(-)